MASSSARFKNGPSRPCAECGGPLILRSGALRAAHYAHLPTANPLSKTSTCGGGESETHAAAKAAIVSHLEKGGVIEAHVRCARCDIVSKRQIGPFNFGTEQGEYACHIEQERVIDQSSMARADVAILVNGEIHTLIEVCHTHVTSEDTVRNRFTWYEFDASRVMWQATRHSQSAWTLRDMRRSKLNLDGEDHQTCTSNADLAFQIGAYRRYFSHPTLKALCVAANGWYWKYIYAWQLPDKDGVDPAVDAVIRKRGKCLRCGEVAMNVSAYTPYCTRCFKRTASESASEEFEGRMKMVPASLKRYDRRFDWLSGTPIWTQGAACSVCQEDAYDGDESCSSYVWFYGKRNICERCFLTRQAVVDDALAAFECQTPR